MTEENKENIRNLRVLIKTLLREGCFTNIVGALAEELDARAEEERDWGLKAAFMRESKILKALV